MNRSPDVESGVWYPESAKPKATGVFSMKTLFSLSFTALVLLAGALKVDPMMTSVSGEVRRQLKEVLLIEKSGKSAEEMDDDGGMAGVSFQRCYAQTEYFVTTTRTIEDAKDGLANDIAPGCYMWFLADLIAMIALIIVCCYNCGRYCPRGCSGASERPMSNGLQFDGKDRNRPCACFCATITGFWGVILTPIGVLGYCIFAPFTCCGEKGTGNKFHDCMCAVRDTFKWMMHAPANIGAYFADGCMI